MAELVISNERLKTFKEIVARATIRWKKFVKTDLQDKLEKPTWATGFTRGYRDGLKHAFEQLTGKDYEA